MESDILFSHSCRICSIELENGVFVFGEEGKQMYLQAKIRKYLYITISLEDRLPKMICENCCKKLEGIHKFATMAVKIQDKFNKLVTHSSLESAFEPKKIETKGLLHTYLTKGIKESETSQDFEVTEMEVKVDPMLILQYSLEDDDCSSDTLSDSESLTSKEKERQECGYYDDMAIKNRKPYNCNVCPRRFTSELALQNHTWNHIPKNRRVLLNNHNNLNFEEDDVKLENNLDQKTSSNASSEGESSENANGIRYTCPICSKIISTKGNLKVHLETHRPKGKYACDICGRIFKTQCNLHRHKEYHEGVQFPCIVCGRVYPTNSTLRAHSITHSDLRPHKCPLCDKTFKRNQDLKFHINQHTGARPYQCPYCPKAFASSGNCFSHRKRMHPLEVERDRERAAKIMR